MARDDNYRVFEAVLYTRVSSDEQEKEGFSIPAQQKLLRGYAADNSIRVVREFTDVETAKVTGRTGFNEMLAFLRQQDRVRNRETRCCTILVEKTDRLYRNLRDYVTLDELDVSVHFVKEGVVLSPDSHSSEKFMHGIKVLMAKQYVEDLGEEVKKGMREKAEQGIWPSKAPVGYRNVEGPNGKKIIEPNPDTAPIATKIFEWYGTGNYSMEDVGKMALDAGLVLKRDGNVRAVIHQMLKNPIYYGDFKFRGKMYQGVHTPLVTRELWDRVQEIRERRRTRKRRRTKRSFAFSRLISCGHCGCALAGEIKKGRYVYYRCTHYHGKCPEKYVREEVLEEKFTEILRSLRFDDEILAWVRDALLDSHVEEEKFHREAVTRLQEEYNRLQRRIDAMYVDKLDGKVGERFYDQKSAEWREEQRAIELSMVQHRTANESYMEEGVALLELANRAADLFEKQPASEKRRLLDFVLSNSTWADGELTPEFRQPFDMIADAAMACATEKAAGASSDDLCHARLPSRCRYPNHSPCRGSGKCSYAQSCTMRCQRAYFSSRVSW